MPRLWTGVLMGAYLAILCKNEDVNIVDEEFFFRDTQYGQIRGAVKSVLGSKKVERYLSIPYAAPPVGELRFEKPEAPAKWEGTRDALLTPPSCPQSSNYWFYVHLHTPYFTHSDEDCLYMNVYVPQTGAADGKMAVLVHIHGGSNEYGMGAMFDGDVLAAQGEIIVVNFNYRLASLGFLSAGPEFPGNYGLMDQAAALKWVSRNIHFFGGDPTKVAIEGHSAGAGDVGFHILSPLSKGFFRYAIMQSGSPTADWALLQDTNTAISSATEFGEKLGCYTSKDMYKLKQCLKTKPWQSIMRIRYAYAPGKFCMSPVVDGLFIQNNTTKLLKEAELNGEAFMAGITNNEGTMWMQGRENVELTPRNLGISIGDTNNQVVKSNLVIHEYRPWDDRDNNAANVTAIANILGDSIIVAPVVDVAKRLSYRTDRLYFYSFDYHSPASTAPKWMGVPHGRDLFYLFGCPFSGHPLYNYTEEDRQVSKVFMNMWTNFVKTGKPSSTVGADQIFFEHFESQNQTYMKINGVDGNGTITVAYKPRPRQVEFWNSILPQLDYQTQKISAEYGTLTWGLVALSVTLFVCMAAIVIFLICRRRH
ncbi:acetylcholinesterase-like [Haliotis rufescens]|uniref:acetylcholinesterase-like n=1 Tax=Haliotis rufescens TaxID=6454 RepID=UPI00201F2E95|nr:acetylcholinesterase-like [Haliotis rufescens]